MLATTTRPGLSARRNRLRRGAAIVESTLVLSVFLMLLFGMFEYCRFLLVLHVTNNAARDGVRYAAVNVTKPATDVTLSEPCNVPLPALRVAVTKVLLSVISKLPAESSMWITGC